MTETIYFLAGVVSTIAILFVLFAWFCMEDPWY